MKQFKVGKKAVKAAVLLCLLAVIVVVCVVVLMGNDSDTADSDLSEPKAESSQNTAKQANTEEEQDMKTTEEQKKPEKETIEWNPDWEYADHSKIHTGSAVLYYSQAEDLKDKVICINAGHGTEGGSSESTLCHPDGSPKVTGGSTSEGAVTATAINEGTTLLNGTSEAEMNLRVAKLVKTKLLEEGFHVLMIRESDDVQLDNIARTVIANNNADCHISIHYDSTENDKGAFFISVPENESYRSMEPVASHWEEHNALGQALIERMEEGGVPIYSSGSMAIDLTQTSYSTIPSVDLEVGDRGSSTSDETLETIASGIAAGVSSYFK